MAPGLVRPVEEVEQIEEPAILQQEAANYDRVNEYLSKMEVFQVTEEMLSSNQYVYLPRTASKAQIPTSPPKLLMNSLTTGTDCKKTL